MDLLQGSENPSETHKAIAKKLYNDKKLLRVEVGIFKNLEAFRCFIQTGAYQCGVFLMYHCFYFLNQPVLKQSHWGSGVHPLDFVCAARHYLLLAFCSSNSPEMRARLFQKMGGTVFLGGGMGVIPRLLVWWTLVQGLA